MNRKRTLGGRLSSPAIESDLRPDSPGGLATGSTDGNVLTWPVIYARRSPPRSRILRRRASRSSLALLIVTPSNPNFRTHTASQKPRLHHSHSLFSSMKNWTKSAPACLFSSQNGCVTHSCNSILPQSCIQNRNQNTHVQRQVSQFRDQILSRDSKKRALTLISIKWLHVEDVSTLNEIFQLKKHSYLRETTDCADRIGNTLIGSLTLKPGR